MFTNKHIMRHIFVIAIGCLFFGTSVFGFTQRTVSFELKLKGKETQLDLNSVFVLPQESYTIDLQSTQWIELVPYAGQKVERTASGWRIWAPSKTGIYAYTIHNSKTGETVAVHEFVMVPKTEIKQGQLNGYKIGQYPQQKTSAQPGFIEITPKNKDVQVSPHFKLGQFLCKQAGQYPKYVMLNEALIHKLEHILMALNAKGIACKSLAIMSGYRTPQYNADIGNVKLSQHQFGNAADIYIDENNDGQMDDINRDGKIDAKDAEKLYALLDDFDRSNPETLGGLGKYKANTVHGPFVHVDVRGKKARWGF